MSVTGVWAQNKIYYTAKSQVTPNNIGAFDVTYNASASTYDSGSQRGTLVFNNAVTSIGLSAFYGCSNLTSITIPNSVTSIGNYAFYLCSSLTSITISNHVTSIGDKAFYGCSHLTSVTIPDRVTSIGNETFCKCSSLTSITIPNSVTSIGKEAFSYCTSLTSITIPNSVTSIGQSVFGYCSSLTSIYVEAQTPPSIENLGRVNTSSCILFVPVGTLSAYQAAAGWNSFSHIGEVNCTLTLLSSDNTAGIVSGSGEYTGCQIVNCCAIPAAGYKFSGWNDGNTENPRIFSIRESTTLTAQFERYESFIEPTQPGMRLRVKKTDGKTYEFSTCELEKVDYYRATEVSE